MSRAVTAAAGDHLGVIGVKMIALAGDLGGEFRQIIAGEHAPAVDARPAPPARCHLIHHLGAQDFGGAVFHFA